MTRETDYAIFERVFGGKLIQGPILLGAGKPNPGDVMDDEAAKEYSALGYGRQATVARYSESNAESMAVLKACCERLPHTVEIGVCHFGTEPQWFVGRTDGDSTESVMEATLEMAIAKFSLLIFPPK